MELPPRGLDFTLAFMGECGPGLGNDRHEQEGRFWP